MDKNKIVLIVVLAIVALMFLLAFFGDSNTRYSEPRPCDKTDDITISELKVLYSGEPRPCDKTDDTTWSELKKLYG